jgi:hypothetical protein
MARRLRRSSERAEGGCHGDSRLASRGASLVAGGVRGVEAAARLIRVETVPVWEEPDGTRRVPDEGEVRDDLPCVGWSNVLVISLRGERHRFLACYRVDD